MELINAVWEIRNLGVSCIEILCNEHDKPAESEEVLPGVDAQYNVAKIPAESSDLLNTAQLYGYRVVAIGIELRGDKYSKNVREISLTHLDEEYNIIA